MAKTIEDIMADLADEAATYPPRLFAIYGVLRELDDVPPGTTYLVWGMDLGDDGVVYWHPGEADAHTSDSLDHVLQFHQRLGTARLDWLDRSEP